MRKTPWIAKVYLFLAAVLIALPTVGEEFYKGVTGKYLVAAESVRGPYFKDSVVYVVQHNLFGALGVIVNRALKEDERAKLDKILANDEVLSGGPVGEDQLRALVYDPTSSQKVVQLLTVGEQSVGAFVEAVKRYPQRIFIIGYAGWGPLQLEIEMLRGDWDTVPVDLDKMFLMKARNELWPELKRQVVGYEYDAHKI